MKKSKEFLLIVASGILLGLPWSIPEFFFAIFLAWIPLFKLEEESRKSANTYQLFNYSFLSFLIWNLMGTWWIAQAQWVGAILIILINAMVQALVFWWISRVRTTLKIPILFPLLLIWLGFEHFHQAWDLAWPWLNLGNSLASSPKIIQWYEYTGVRGGSLWILLINLSAWYAIRAIQYKNTSKATAYSSLAVLIFAIPFWYSVKLRVNFAESDQSLQIALVQPNLDPYTEKFDPVQQKKHLSHFYKMADSVCTEQTQILFGPETLIVQQIDEKNYQQSSYYQQLLDFQKKHPGLTLALGIHTYQKAGKRIPPGSRYNKEGDYYFEAFNTALFQESGKAPQFYHKTKLVPLFERMPFVDYLTFLGKYSLELGGYTGTYSKRQGSKILTSADSSFSILPIVCFESVFGPYCAQRIPEGNSFLAVLTNDGWWKQTPGYQHHFHFSIMRAIETRRDLVRVANTGISALIDAKGTVIVKTPWWKRTSLSGCVRLYHEKTFFSQHGDYIGRISLFFGILLLLYGGIQIRIQGNNKNRF
ncbi:MAG: apolipoprotein N-acyltransferase [Marinifilaceae bacterium]